MMMNNLTQLQKIQLEIELEMVRKDKLSAISEQKYAIAAEARGKEREIMDKLGLDDYSSFYKKKNLIEDENQLDNSVYGVKHLTWDYKGHKGHKGQTGNWFGNQHDWNQTLMTQINQVSAQIHKSTCRDSATHIYMNPNMEPIMDSLEYTNINDDGVMMLGGRYEIVFDMNLTESVILVKHIPKAIDDKGEFILIPELIKESNDGMMSTLSLKLHRRGDEVSTAIIKEFENKCFGTIDIINYTKDDYNIELREKIARHEKDTRSTSVVDVIRNIQHERISNGLQDNHFMHTNYVNDNVETVRTNCAGMSNEEILKHYQDTCDSTKGILFYFNRTTVSTKTTIGEKLLMQSVMVELKNTEKTLEKMNEISSNPSFHMWAGTYHSSNTKTGVRDTDFKDLLGMNKTIFKSPGVYIEEGGSNRVNWSKMEKLNTQWTPELAQDINHIDAETELVNTYKLLLLKEIPTIESNEIIKVTTIEGLLSTMESLGYILGPTIYDPMDFVPKKSWYKK